MASEYSQLKAAISTIRLNLTVYLSQAGYHGPVSEEVLNEYDRNHLDKAPREPHPIHPGKFIYLGSDFNFRNKELKVKRVKNTLISINTLELFLEKAKVDEIDLKEQYRQIKKIVKEGLDKNNSLSSEYGKAHRSFAFNRSLGLGFFRSWWKQTWFQSRAGDAFEKSIAHVNDLLKAYDSSNRFSY